MSGMTRPKGTLPFAPFEWMIALRYLRARRKTGFVSVIAGFSLVGIMLGVATLIVVMSVMNGFHKELLDKIVGINGHIFLQAADAPLTDYKDVTSAVSAVPGVDLAIPLIEGAAGVSSPYNQAGALVRGISEADIKKLPGIAGNVRVGTLNGFDEAGGVAIGQRLAENLSLRVGDKITILTAKGAQTPFGVASRRFRSAWQNLTIFLSTCRCRKRKPSSTKAMKPASSNCSCMIRKTSMRCAAKSRPWFPARSS
jgi:lipoprotein-releasing system permease protein